MVTLNSHVKPDFYKERAAAHQVQRDCLAKLSLRISNLRGLTFVVFLGAGGFWLHGTGGWPLALLSLAGLVAFGWLLYKHVKVIRDLDTEDHWILTNLQAAMRVDGTTWQSLPYDGAAFRNPEHPYSDDLDLFGHASVFQRISVAQTSLGQARLAAFLTDLEDVAAIRARQSIVRLLAPELELRQQFEVLARGTVHTAPGQPSMPADVEPLYSWAEAPVSQHRGAVAWYLTLSGGTFISLAAASFGYVPIAAPIALLGMQLLVLIRTRPQRRALNKMLSVAERTLVQMAPLFELLEQRRLIEQLGELPKDSSNPSTALRALRRASDWFELRHNGMVYPFINLLLMWDVYCGVAFENWRLRHGGFVRAWLKIIGEMEALSSFAGLQFDEPGYCFAEIAEEEASVSAVALGHPLLSNDSRVANDVQLLESGYGLLVTGSNMSGKSTYLRAVGLAVVMGLAGAPVCAKALAISRVRVATSMRISDDLASGKSHFFAEITKLHRVLTAADGPVPVLFLLDEILHGTNSRERRIGARYILSELLRKGALGAVSTHDLALCELTGDLSTRLTKVHFRESVQEQNMFFDYRVYPGTVTAGNALRLMNRLGIAVPLDSDGG